MLSNKSFIRRINQQLQVSGINRWKPDGISDNRKEYQKKLRDHIEQLEQSGISGVVGKLRKQNNPF